MINFIEITYHCQCSLIGNFVSCLVYWVYRVSGEKPLSLNPMWQRGAIAEALKQRNQGIPLGCQKIDQPIEK